MTDFSCATSLYPFAPDDPQARIVDVSQAKPTNGLPDITDILQKTLDAVKLSDGYGIVLLPSGEYTIRKTIYIPRAVRLFGFGKTRPVITLLAGTPGFNSGEPGYHDDMKYMFWFTGNVPARDSLIVDANPGTFYSALSNMDFVIQENNPCAVVIRAHFAQNCFISYCHLNIGSGKAGIDAVGNEMEHLSFEGGDYGIYTGKCSPGWPFVLTDSDFKAQRIASIGAHESGLTLRRVSFQHAPCAIASLDGFWDKQVLFDCVLDSIGTGFEIATENSTCTQYNMRNLLCKNVDRFAYFKESQTALDDCGTSYLLERFTHGYVAVFGINKMEKKTIFEAVPYTEDAFVYSKDTQSIPPQESWINVKSFGACGDGKTDDTRAIQAAAASGKAIYFPQGKYMVTDTIVLAQSTSIIGMNPISTQLILPDNAPLFAGIGAPKALLETPKGGTNRIFSMGLDTNARNPRALACKWQSAACSYMYDVKFVGGHGRIERDNEFPPSYNATRTADYDSDRPWDTQFWSLWITNGGGGVFKNIWTANPYAEAGIFISETSTKGAMYQVSSEHHVRHEIWMRNVSNWSFFAIQTEEEVAEGSHCQPFELCACHDLLFANFYAFRVIWVDNDYPSVMKTWNCYAIEIQNLHNFTQMKFTIDNAVVDAVSGKKTGFWQLAQLTIEDTRTVCALPTQTKTPKMLAEGFDYVDAMCQDSKGNVYICDARVRRIYKYDAAEKSFSLVTSMHYRPLSLACDTQDNLLVVVEYKPVPHAMRSGKPELSYEEHGARSQEDWGACFYPFYRKDRRVRVYCADPRAPEETMRVLLPQPLAGTALETLYYPSNQWRDNNDMLRAVCIPDEKCYIAPDNKTGIVHTPALARAASLVAANRNIPLYMADEYNKYILRLDVDDTLHLQNPQIAKHLGEYSAIMTDAQHLLVCDCNLYDCCGSAEEAIELPHRPAVLLLSHDGTQVFISARHAVYAMKLK